MGDQLAGAVYFIAGIIATYLLSRPGLEAIQRYRRHITWRAISKAVHYGLVEIEGGKWRPDVIVGLNSGIVPASIIALNLRVSDLLFYDCLPRYIGGIRRAEMVLNKGIDLSGKKVLVIDDQAYTGRSIERLYEHLITTANADPALVRRYVLFTHSSGAGPIELEIPPYGHVAGGVKEMPWVISAAIKPFWEDRERTSHKD